MWVFATGALARKKQEATRPGGTFPKHTQRRRRRPSGYLGFAGRALFFLLPLLRLPTPPPEFGAHATLKVRHLPESHAATQSQELRQANTVHWGWEGTHSEDSDQELDQMGESVLSGGR